MGVQPWVYDNLFGGRVVATVTLANGDESTDLGLFNYPEKTIEISGTFGAGGTINIRGKNVSSATVTEYLALHRANDPTLTLTGLTAVILSGLVEDPQFIKADVDAGDGTTELTVTVVGYTSR